MQPGNFPNPTGGNMSSPTPQGMPNTPQGAQQMHLQGGQMGMQQPGMMPQQMNQQMTRPQQNFPVRKSPVSSCFCKFYGTVEPRYNEVLGTMKITLLYQVSHYIRVKNKKYKEQGPAKWPCYKKVLLYPTSL